MKEWEQAGKHSDFCGLDQLEKAELIVVYRIIVNSTVQKTETYLKGFLHEEMLTFGKLDMFKHS